MERVVSLAAPRLTPPMTQRTGGQVLVDQLRIQGCDRIFTVPGESFLAVLDALHDAPEIDTIVCRQEGGVAYMADADGKMTGRPGVAFVTRGPGATNASAGVHVAFQDSTPMILFIGDVARGDRDREGFQEIDFPAFFSPIAKWAARIEDARRIPEYVARAYRVATAGRPGPVVLALPEDMLRDEVEALDRPCVPPLAEEPDPGAVQAMFELLKDATNPVAIVGGADWSPRAVAPFRQLRLPLRHPRRRRLPPPGRDLQHVPGLCRQPRLRSQPQAAAAHPRRRPDHRRRPAARRGDHRRLHADHARSSRPDVGPRPSRPQRARPRLSRRPADLRRHGRVRRDGRRMDRPRARPLLRAARKRTRNGSNGRSRSRATA